MCIKHTTTMTFKDINVNIYAHLPSQQKINARNHLHTIKYKPY